jgi:hypothetical protein
MAKGHRNGLYTLAAEYRRRHPKATATDAWRHFVAVASLGDDQVLRSYDGNSGRIEYAPRTDSHATRTVTQKTFANLWARRKPVSASGGTLD